MNNNYLEAFEWRYATKKMNGQDIPEEKLSDMLEAKRLSPSALGFTRYTVLVIRDQEIR